MKRKTWKQKIGKRLLQHVRETTQRCTLAEVRANVAGNPVATACSQCARVLELTAKRKKS